MNIDVGDYLISDDKNLIQFDKVFDLLSKTYWASHRSKETVQKSLENSLCFGVYHNDVQIGLARAVTDYAVVYYLCDVVIDENFRGQGLGKAMMKCVTEHESLAPLRGFLGTEHAHGLYEKFGFELTQGTMMCKRPEN